MATAREKKEVSEDIIVPETITKESIQKLIDEAVNNATSKIVKEYEEKDKEKEKQLGFLKKSLEEKKNDVKIEPYRDVTIMNMTVGGGNFADFHVMFKELFDTDTISYEQLKIMVKTYRASFQNNEIIIVDEDVRKVLNLDKVYLRNGANKETFENMLLKNVNDMIVFLDGLAMGVAHGFLKFYVDMYIKGDKNARDAERFKALKNFYFEKYNITEIMESITEMMDDEY